MEELISVIVPVFNVENSIQRCVNSILQQTKVKFEIIIVDDGSRDHSLEICRSLENSYGIIKVYHTENKGVSHARNFGMDKANGKWFVFVDADDELGDNALYYAIKLKNRLCADAICWNMISVTSNGERSYPDFNVKKNLLREEEIEDLLPALYEVPSKKGNFYGILIRAVCGKMLSEEIIKKYKIKFLEDMKLGEDAAFLFEYFQHCKCVAFLNKPLYKYYETGNSATKKYKRNYFSMQKKEADVIKSNYEKYGMNPEEALVHFWNVAFMTYIENELKVNKSGWKVIQKANKYLKNDTVRKYFRKQKSDSKLSMVKSVLMKYNKTLIVSVIYVRICKKNYLSQIKKEK